MKSVVIYDEFVMPTKIRDVTKIFSSRAMVDKQKEGCEVQKQYEKYGPTTTICDKVEKNFHEKDGNPFLFVLDLEIDQKHPKNQATTVDLGKLREGSTPTAQLQPEGKKEKDLNKDKGEVGALNKDSTSSPPLEKEHDEMTTDKERDRAFNRDVISSPSFEKKEGVFNADKIGLKDSDKGDLNADKTGPKASDEVAMSLPYVSERKEENLYTSKNSYKAAKFKYENIERRKADRPRQDLSPFMILLQLFDWIVSSKIGVLLLLLCFAPFVICKSEGNQEPTCLSPKEPISKLYFLKGNETCTSLNVNLQCANGLIAVCLPVVPGSDLTVGCARDRPINGKGCPEWNIVNGCYVLNVRYNECETCSDYYLLSNSREVAKCFKDERATTTEQITVTSAKGTRNKRSSLEHGVQTTAASPNKTSGKSEGNKETVIGLSVGGVIFIIIVLPLAIVLAVKLRNRRRNQETPQSVSDLEQPQQQPLVEFPVQQQPLVEFPVQQQPLVEFPVQQQPLVEFPVQQQPLGNSDHVEHVFLPNGNETNC